MNAIRAADDFIKHYPFIVILICLLIVVVPGYYRLQVIADDAQDTADTNRQVLAVLEAEQTADLINRCRDINAANQATRAAFFDVFDVIETLVDNPAEVLPPLRASVPRPEDQDLDCDGNGHLDRGDYSR